METGSVVAQSGAVLRSIYNLVMQIQTNRDVKKSNPNRVEKAISLTISVQTQLKVLQDLLCIHEPQMSDQCKTIVQEQLNSMNPNLARAQEELDKLQRMCSPVDNVSRARCLVNASSIERQLQVFERILEDSCNNIIPMLQLVEQRTDAFKDVFRQVYNVPANEGRGLTFDMSETSTTPEGQLKRLLLNSCGSSETIAAVDNRPHIAIPAHGLGGVGKTCALRELGWDDEVRGCFKDGIHFLSFGKDVNDRKFVEDIAEIVLFSGGSKVSDDVKSTGTVSSAVSLSISWFANRNFLILADDIWEPTESPTGEEVRYVKYLKKIVQCGKNARLVISTRSQKVATLVNSGKIVEFSVRDFDSKEAKSILCKSAGFVLDDILRHGGEALEKFMLIYQRCGGLPLALAVCGDAIGKMAHEYEQQTRMDVWNDYYKATFDSTSSADNFFQRNVPGEVGHRGLHYIFSSSLEQLAQRTESNSGTAGLSVADMYYSLCVLEKQQWIPCHTLAKLWSCSGDEAATSQARAFADLSLTKVSQREASGMKSLGINIHDLQHDFCAHMAKKKQLLEVSHTRLLNGHRSFPPGASECHVRDWWSKELPPDGYLHRNLARHLIASNAHNELEGLLSDYRWTERQMMLNGLGLLTDFEVMNDSFQKRITACSASSNEELESLKLRAEGLSMIRRAYYISWSFLSANKNELPTQMYGRLLSLKDSNHTIKSYVDSLLLHAAKPWLRTVVPCLQTPVGKMRAKWNTPQSVRSVASVGDGRKVVVAGFDRMLRIIDIETGDVYHELGGHTNDVNCVASPMHGKYIISGGDDCTVRVWNAQNREPMEYAIISFSSIILSVAVSGDGSKVAVGCGDGSVGVRKVPNVSDVVCNMTTGPTLRRRRDGVLGCFTGQSGGRTGIAHTGGVNSVALSRDGRIALSGSYDKTVRIWDADTGDAIGDALRGHKNHVWCVALSADATRAVSGGWDGIRVWDVENGSVIAGPLLESEGTQSVAFSGDCTRIAAGNRNGSISLYDANTLEMTERPLRGHSDWVNSVAFQNDSARMMSGSDDCSVRVWELDEKDDANVTAASVSNGVRPRYIGTAVSVALSADSAYVAVGMGDGRVWIFDADRCVPDGEPMIGLELNVWAVAFSDDGKLIVSGDDCGNIMIWDVWTRTLCRQPMTVDVDDRARNWVYCVAFALADSQVVAAYGDGSIRVWRVADGVCIQTIAHKLDLQMSVTQLVAAAFPSEVEIEDVFSKEEGVFSNDDIHCKDGWGLWLRGEDSESGALAFQSNIYLRSWWAFDKVRDRVWARGIEGGVFIADVERECPRL